MSEMLFPAIKKKDLVLYGTEKCVVIGVSTHTFRIKSKRYGRMTVYKKDGTLSKPSFLNGPSHVEKLA